MDEEKEYKLEEMKQLRAFSSALVQEIVKLEVFAVTSIAAFLYFNVYYPGCSKHVELSMQYGPSLLAFLILFKAFRFARRIQLIDEYLMDLEKEFVGGGAWVSYFYKHDKKEFLLIGCIAITSSVF